MDSKQNEFGSFSKMLRKLQMENVALPELRQLKQQHTYLEKLRQQRSKIEELKAKYDAVEEQLASYIDQNSGQKQLIDEQHRALQLLEDKLAESEKKRTQAENALGRAVEIQREKSRNKLGELSSEVQELRREAKAKDMLLFELEDQIESTRSQMKQQFLHQKRKYAAEWEEKLKLSFADRSAREQENQQLRELVTRQHKALQIQNDQYEQLLRRNEELSQTVSELQDQLSLSVRQRQQAQQRVCDLTDLAARMQSELQQRRSGASTKNQIQQLRKKMGELAKDELDRIEFIVNEIE